MVKRDLASLGTYQELEDWRGDRKLLELAAACIDAQRRAAASVVQAMSRPDRQSASAAVSEAALGLLLESGRDVHGIATDRSISTVIAFNAKNIPDSVSSREVNELRKSLDQAVGEKARDSFTCRGRLEVSNSGHFWYPPGAHMAWHTNSGAPGLRMYISHAEEPGKSFFRYRDPDTGRVITSMDDAWNVRVFQIRANKLLWHAVYSDTHRFSLGYMIYPMGLRQRIGRKFKSALGS